MHIKNVKSIPGILKAMQPQILVGFNMNLLFQTPNSEVTERILIALNTEKLMQLNY